MPRLAPVIWLAIAAVFFHHAALAKQVLMGSTSLNLVPPQGYCDLDEANSRDAQLIALITHSMERGPNKLMAVSADCGELAQFRAGRRNDLERLAHYQASRKHETIAPPPGFIKDACKGLRAEAPDFTAQTSAIARQVEDVFKGFKSDGLNILGVFGEDNRACYFASVHRYTIQGIQQQQLGISATLFVKDRLLFFYNFSPFTSADVIPGLIERHRQDVAALTAAN